MEYKMRTKKKRTNFSIIRETKDLCKYIDDLPDEHVYKFVSFGEFSSIAFINYIASKTTINNLHCTTLMLGKKHLQVLNQLYKINKIKKINMIVGEITKKKAILKAGMGIGITLLKFLKLTNGK